MIPARHWLVALAAAIAGCATTGTVPAAPAPAPAATGVSGSAAAPSPVPALCKIAESSGTPLRLIGNPDFEADPTPDRECPPSWWCSMHADPHSFQFRLDSEASRGRFLRVTRLRPEPWAMANQGIPARDLVGKRVRLAALVNTESLDEGVAGVMLVLQASGGRQMQIRNDLLTKGRGWRVASTEIEVVQGTQLLDVILVIEGGGTVGFDDVRLSLEGGPAR